MRTSTRRFILRLLATLRLDVRPMSFSDAMIIKRRLRTDDFTFAQIGANDGISFDSL